MSPSGAKVVLLLDILTGPYFMFRQQKPETDFRKNRPALGSTEAHPGRDRALRPS